VSGVALTGAGWPGLAQRLAGQLVVLEPLAREHAEGLFEASRDPRIWRWLEPDVSVGRAVFDRWLEDALRRSEAGLDVAFATLDAHTARPIGSTRYLAPRPEDRVVEIGWTWLAPQAWKTGANVEAKLLQLEHAFERLGCVRVEFKTNADNERSRAALAALPARFEGIFRKHMRFREGHRDSAYYAIVDEEWPEVRKALETRLTAKVAAG
jgi:N-acetyltransferase